jgi:hypothetical protein
MALLAGTAAGLEVAERGCLFADCLLRRLLGAEQGIETLLRLAAGSPFEERMPGRGNGGTGEYNGHKRLLRETRRT